MNETVKKLPLTLALAWILGSTFLCTGSVYSFMKYREHKKSKNFHDETQFITKLIQTGPHRDVLPSYLLEEILGLSKDHPTSFFVFDVKLAEENLKKVPMIKGAEVFILKPDTIYIDYTMREPIAMLYDYENIAVDDEGFLFPFSPFYSPKELPQIYLGKTLKEEGDFFKPLDKESFILAKQVLNALQQNAMEQKFFIKRIDVSSAFDRSYGRKEIVIDISDQSSHFSEDSQIGYLHRVRVSPKDYLKQLGNYVILHKELTSSSYATISDKQEIEEKVIDLRLEGLAFIDKLRD